ncbi:UDP-N-acetylmuramate--L-alanine ligase [Melghirimyces profundicolus]|uniref:UDP-N-acetylmuramate--L-alanine ligase n=1 Tax=Melghirimyces profundicolus TaxID=1242148 RepID=A0A2T6BTH9_9BACL|nr:UDP-N-acetylmuramate--L-alanine ligase [Melghirimyces profundicolus]PTX59382.1 UDP-N-acetylmuramate--L-alanine ligase [Melghirimyces profundicolus]
MNPKEHVHFIGIGGYGMSAIARVLLESGYRVTGSDVAENKLTQRLAALGAEIHIGHQSVLVEGADRVVYSSSIPDDNVELVAARAKGIPVFHRSRMLADLLNHKQGIAVAGAHGKTTTSSMIAQTMEESGADPTYVIGGEVVSLGSNAKAGSSPFVVAEADESDGTFLEYFPHIAVVTNVEPDHLENYDGSFEKLKGAYRQFLSQVKKDGVAVLGWDDPYLREIGEESEARVITYALESEADYTATDIRQVLNRTRFTVNHHGTPLGEVTIHVPGRHNVANALAAVVVCMEAGLTFEQVAEGLSRFRGAKRRFQVIGEVEEILVVDDYAHHPTEIRTTVEGLKAMNRRILAVFQPQRYSRTHLLMEEFSRAFGGVDELILTDIYSPPGEAPIDGVTSERLARMVRENSNPNTVYRATKEDVETYLLERACPGDLVLTMGAGDIWRVAHNLVPALKARQKEKMK